MVTDQAVRVTLIALLLSLPVPLVSAEARKPVEEVVQAIAGVPAFLETAISSDHSSVAWVHTAPYDLKSRSVGSAISWAPATHPDQSRRVTAAIGSPMAVTNTGEERAPTWSPDSRELAFLSDARTPGQLQLYVFRVSDQSVRRVAQFEGFVDTPRWSADGKTIALLYTEGLKRAAGPVAAIPMPTGVVDEEQFRQRIALVDVSSGKTRLVSPADLYVYDFDWSPDGAALVGTAARGPGDSGWYGAQLYRFNVRSAEATLLYEPHMQILAPRWSPDGQSIAFIGGLSSDQGVASGEVYLLPATGGDARNLTPAYPSSVFSLSWLPGSKALILADASGGGSGLTRLDIRSGRMTSLWRGAETIRGPAGAARGIAIAADGKFSTVIRESFNEPPGLWIGAIGQWRRFVATSTSPPHLWGNAESLQWQSDGFTVQGWLLTPPDVDPARKYPLIVWVHGGPAWLSAPAWPAPEFRAVPLASQGYFVFLPNPRGSSGFGERFKSQVRRDYGGPDLRDILAGTGHVVDTKPIDAQRVGIGGWSHGGYMAMWAVTQTQLFRAAVAGAGISNFQSYFGQTGIDGWMKPYFGASIYDNLPLYAARSPINFVKNARTPTLLVAGEQDIEGPPAQSFEFWRAMKVLNVKSQLIIYPREGHHFTDPSHSLDLTRQMLKWFDENMPPQ